MPIDGQVVAMPLARFKKNAPAGPNIKQKKAAVKTYLKKHPGLSLTQTDELMQAGGHEVLWTPPYMPDLQPIELLWAKVKGAVARKAMLNRSRDVAREQTEEEFGRIDQLQCEKLVNHTEHWMSEWMKRDDGGSLQRFDDLQDLIDHGPNINPIDPDDPGTIGEDSTDDEKED